MTSYRTTVNRTDWRTTIFRTWADLTVARHYYGVVSTPHFSPAIVTIFNLFQVQSLLLSFI